VVRELSASGISAMPDALDTDNEKDIVERVDDPVVADANPVEIL